jgi:acetyltransferase
MSRNIDPLINPKSIAVVGASSRPGTVGNSVFLNLLQGRYQGPVYPVNPKATHINSVRTYTSLSDIPHDVDLAILVIPPPRIPEVIEEAGRKKVKGLLVISAGFKEIGPEGAALEAQLKEVRAKYDIPLVGPNCLGIINTDPDTSLNASFAIKIPRPGNLAFISQSGAICTAVLDYADMHSLGFSKFVSFGNKADVNEVDLLQYLGDDPKTKVICMYLEDISNGRAFTDTCRKIFWEKKKPMLAIKAGRSPEGARAASSHTGSLAGSDAVYEALLLRSGIQQVNTIEELFDLAEAYSYLPMPRGRSVAIITNAGGPGILATDAAVRSGLKLSEFTEKTKTALRKHLPPTAAVGNPVDVIGDATSSRYEAATSILLKGAHVDAIVVILTPQSMTDILETAKAIHRLMEETDKPIICSFMGGSHVQEGVRYLKEHGIPNYMFPEEAITTLGSMCKYAEILHVPHRESKEFEVDKKAAEAFILKKLEKAESIYLTQVEASQLLGLYGFPLLKSGLATDIKSLKKIVAGLKPPFAMKIMSADVVHKWDVGGVILNVPAEEAAAAYDTILANVESRVPGAKIQGVYVEEMAQKGVEVIIGANRDPMFGPLCMFGLGGTMVEVMKDVTFRLAPMWQASAERMIRQIKGFKALQGLRGKPPADLQAIENCLLRLSQLTTDHREIIELDINPLIVYEEGCVVADSRILLRRRKDKTYPDIKK